MFLQNNLFLITVCLAVLKTISARIINIQPYSPFKMIGGNSAEINVINKTLKCDGNPELEIKNCARKCLKMEVDGTGCPGFIVDSSRGNKCALCGISEFRDVQNSTYTTLANSHKVVLLLGQERTNPEVSMSFDNVNDETITGINTIGTTSFVEPSDYVNGKNGKSLYLHDGGKVRLSGSEHACWTNVDLCTHGVTMSLWVKPQDIRTSYFATTGSIFQKGFGFYLNHDGLVLALVTLDSGRYHAKSKSKLTIGIWTHVTCIYEESSGISIYMDGILEEDFDEDDTWTERILNEVDWDAHIGVRDSVPYNEFPVDGYVDDFKYHYRTLTSLGEYYEHFY